MTWASSARPTKSLKRDLIEVIKDKFRRMEKTGELARLQEDLQAAGRRSVENPKPVQGDQQPQKQPGRFTSTRPGRLTVMSLMKGQSFCFPPAPHQSASTMTANSRHCSSSMRGTRTGGVREAIHRRLERPGQTHSCRWRAPEAHARVETGGFL